MKKLLISLGSVAVVAAPISVVLIYRDIKPDNSFGITIVKSTINDVYLMFKNSPYFIKEGSTKIKVVVYGNTLETAVYGYIEEKDGYAITANTPTKDLRLDGEKINPDDIGAFRASTDTAYGITVKDKNISFLLASRRELAGEILFYSKGKVTSKENAISSINDLLKGLDLAVDSIEFVPENKSIEPPTEAYIKSLHIGVKSDLDARDSLVKDFAKLTISVEATGGNISDDIFNGALLSSINTDAGIKAFLAGDANVDADNVTITNYPDLPTEAGAVSIHALYTNAENKLSLIVKVGDTVGIPLDIIVNVKELPTNFGVQDVNDSTIKPPQPNGPDDSSTN